MICVCPTCGDYYDGKSMKFCRADGAPLKQVNSNDPTWSQAVAGVEEKARVDRKAKFRSKLRRTLVITITVLIAMMLVFVTIVHGLIYFRQDDVSEAPSAELPAPITSPSPSPTYSPSPSPSPTHAPSPRSYVSSSPSPTPRLIMNGKSRERPCRRRTSRRTEP